MGGKKMELTNRGSAALAWAATAAASAVTAFFALLTVKSADDFWYANFIGRGWDHFIAQWKLHFESFNGRVLVHLATQVILYLGSWSYALTALICLLTVPLASAGAQGRRGAAALTAALFTPAFLTIPRSVLSQGLLWTAAFCNYMLPSAMLCGLMAAFTRLTGREHVRPAAFLGCLLLAFACGAATEQSGGVATALALWFFLRALIRRRGRALTSLGVLCAGAGLWTIFLSPATQARMKYSTPLGSLWKLMALCFKNLGPVSEELSATAFMPALFIAVFGLTALRLARPGGGHLAAALLVPAAAAALIWPFLDGPVLTWWGLALFFLTFLCGVALVLRGDEAPGLLLFMGLLSLALVLAANAAERRTLLPLCVDMLASASLLAARTLENTPPLCRGLLPAGLCAVCVVCALPMAKGVLGNYKVELENRANVREALKTGKLNYRVDYDLDYTWSKLNDSFTEEYLKGVGLDPSIPINFYSSQRPSVSVDGVRYYPCYYDGDGAMMLTVRIVEYFGGTVEAVNGNYDRLIVTTPWSSCFIAMDGNDAVFTWTDASGTERSLETRRLMTEERNWFPAEVYEQVFGIRAEPDPERNTIDLFPPSAQP